MKEIIAKIRSDTITATPARAVSRFTGYYYIFYSDATTVLTTVFGYDWRIKETGRGPLPYICIRGCL